MKLFLNHTSQLNLNNFFNTILSLYFSTKIECKAQRVYFLLLYKHMIEVEAENVLKFQRVNEFIFINILRNASICPSLSKFRMLLKFNAFLMQHY